MKLIAKDINDLLMSCFIEDEDIKMGDPRLVELIKGDYIPLDVTKYKTEIKELLLELNEKFFMRSDQHPNGGEGDTFMNLPFDKHGHQWGEQHNAMELVALGISAGYIKYCLPRKYWSAMPGGMPYIQISFTDKWSVINV
ncbi:MAG: hypothetical protein COA63_014000 [Methylophaga sp.]|nr:hypothetical protein [Methylophaga sp.]